MTHTLLSKTFEATIKPNTLAKDLRGEKTKIVSGPCKVVYRATLDDKVLLGVAIDNELIEIPSEAIQFDSPEKPIRTRAHTTASYTPVNNQIPGKSSTGKIRFYTTWGPVRGTCGHAHRSQASATECMEKDSKYCDTQGGYTDRSIRPISDRNDIVNFDPSVGPVPSENE